MTSPSKAQLDYIKNLGGDPSHAQSKAHASQMIDALKESTGGLATNRQLARLILIGLKDDPRNFSKSFASDLLDEHITDWNSKQWENYKVSRQVNGMVDVPDVIGNYSESKAEIENRKT